MTNWFQIKMVLIGLVLLVCLCTSGYGTVDMQQQESGFERIPVYVDGRLEFMGYAENGQVYLPLRSFCRSLCLGAVMNRSTEGGTRVELYYEGERHSLTAREGDVYLYVNDRIVYLELPMVSRGSTLLVPVEGLCGAFGVAVSGTEPVELHTDHLRICAPGSEVYPVEDLKWLSHIIYAEAGNQSIEGQICVGNVVLNRVADGRFPDSVKAVVFSPNQFCPVKSGTIYCTPDEEAVAAAKLCLEGVNLAGESLYFVNPSTGATGWFRQNLTYAMRVGDHDFYY